MKFMIGIKIEDVNAALYVCIRVGHSVIMVIEAVLFCFGFFGILSAPFLNG